LRVGRGLTTHHHKASNLSRIITESIGQGGIFWYGLSIRKCDGELHNLYSSPDIIRQMKSRRMRWAGHVARMGEGRKVYWVLVGKPKGERPLGRPECR
jgi:hypothetical protein